jgi:hypothetical protein
MTASSTCNGEFEIGMSAAEALGLDDPVIDVAITPNRPDALGVYGIARDLAAKGLGKLKPLDVPQIKGSYASPIDVELRFDDDTSRCLFDVRRPPHQGREERPLARVASAPADVDRPAPHLGAGGHHQLHHVRPWPAACTCSTRTR